MSTNDYSAIKRLVGEGRRPTVRVKRFDRNEVQSSAKQTKHYNPVAAKDDKVVPQIDQGPIGDSSQYPYSAIGICFIQSGDNNWFCTGALVGPNVVLTVGNAIPWGQEWTMQFIPAYNNGNAPFGIADVSQVWGYNPGNSTTDDYLVCHLETSIGYTTGWFGTWGSSNGGDYQADGIIWNSVGYPDAAAQVGVTSFSVNNTSSGDGGGSMDLDTQEFITSGWVGGPLWSTYPFSGIDESDNGPHIAAVVAGVGSSLSIFGVISEWQVNEGGTDMVGLVVYAQDNWPA